MDNAKQHWKILRELGTDLENKVREFMVIGGNGDGVIVATEDGLGYWLGKMEFGYGNLKKAIEPTRLDVPNLASMAQGHKHILLLTKSGQIYAMGKNNQGQLGLGNVDQQTHFTPQLISIPHKFISVRCGYGHSVALTEDGKVWAWGTNYSGQVGMPHSTGYISSPHQITELDSCQVVTVECGYSNSLALTDQGEVYAWGWIGGRQFSGNESEISSHTPTRILTASPVKSMAAGCDHILLLTLAGEVYSCGGNHCGQLGLSTTTEYSYHLCKVEGLPPISQIASHFFTFLSIAMSHDKQCFVWGQLANETSISTPRELPPLYSTVESPHSFFSAQRSTPHSFPIPETPPSPLSSRMARMFDNPETSPDVQFVVEQRSIHAHRIILSNSSDYFDRMFSERWLAPVGPGDPVVRVTISDHSYQVFYAFLRFLYTDCLKVLPDFLPELFELSTQYLDSDLQQLCISRMLSTITPVTCCLYYPLTHRHSLLPELATTRMSEVVNSAAYQSMEPNLRNNLTNEVVKFLGN